MRKLINRSHIIKQNMVAIIGFLLLFYFSYHALLGERSFVRYMSLEREITKVSANYDGLHDEREALETKVMKLRPDTLDRDMLEERANYVLGYYYENTEIIPN